MDTLKAIKNGKSISRFGDGEFNLIFGDDLPFQKYSYALQNRLELILQDTENCNCVIAIPYAIYSLKPYNIRSKKFWFCYFANNRKRLYRILNRKSHYYDSQITRIYVNRANKRKSVIYFNLWKEIWKDKNVLLVEGELSRCGVGNDLFDGCKKLSRLLCPSQNAFLVYDDIFNWICTNGKNFDLLILALGPTATVLSFDLAKYGFWAIDAGNMDNEYEWMQAKSKIPVANKNKYTFEAKDGEKVDVCTDENYICQIIGRIGNRI